MSIGKFEPRPPGFWEPVKEAYFGGERILDVCAHFGITKGEFDYYRRQAGWPMRNKAPVNRERLVGRIYWLMNKHIAAMERELDAGNQKDVAVLNQLVGSLSKLMRFEASARGDAKHAKAAGDLNDIREKLVRRIEELKRG
jgi:hypothetical protein